MARRQNANTARFWPANRFRVASPPPIPPPAAVFPRCPVFFVAEGATPPIRAIPLSLPALGLSLPKALRYP